MKRFIAYFDYLGYKALIENNDLDEQQFAITQNLITIESALSKGKIFRSSNDEVSFDISNSSINCVNYSDTIIFFSVDESIESLIEILTVATKFNGTSILDIFPLRGALVYGELGYHDFKQETKIGSIYNINPIYGKGLVLAHEKAESQNWAGSVIDESLIDKISNLGMNVDEFLKPYTKKYTVPYKKGKEFNGLEYVLNITSETIKSEHFEDIKDCIYASFKNYNKTIDDKLVQKKFDNTLAFLKSCIEY